MSVAIFLAAAVILGGVVVVAMGRGGELARERPQLSARTDFRTWSDVASYRPPAALLGYHAATTERALTLIARTIAERDAEIEWLRERLAEASPDAAAGAADTSAPPVRAGYPARQDPFGQDPFGQDPFRQDSFRQDSFRQDSFRDAGEDG
ncbi:MAG: hypothetical protein WAK71_29115 [Streptosporangiaceae bacterium]